MTQEDERTGPPDRRGAPGDQPVASTGIRIGVAYLAALTAGFMILLVVIWPQPDPKLGSVRSDSTVALQLAQQYWSCDSTMVSRWRVDSTVRDPKCVSVMVAHILMSEEQRLFLIVILAGTPGSLLHALRSFSQYVGRRKLRQSWLVMYFLLPFTGSVIAVVFYVVIRGGFFAPGTGVPQTSPFAFAAMSFLVGLFSQVAIEKLKLVAESFFTKPDAGPESLTSEEEAPVLRRAQRVASTNGGPKDAIDIEGVGFTEATRLEVNGQERTPELRTSTQRRLMLNSAERAVLENGGELSVQVKNGGKNSTAPLTVTE